MKNLAVLLAPVLLSACGWTPGESKTRAQANHLIAGFAIYRAEFGTVPDLAPHSVLDAMYYGNPKRWSILAPTDDEAKARAFLDAWNRPFQFSEVHGKLLVTSPGRDGILGSSDDVIVSEK
jgi:hypothetical protein